MVLPDGTVKAIEPSLHNQRRYEIAKAVLAGFAVNLSNEWDWEFLAMESVRGADALLAELEE